jgi:hypothetical protein
MKMALRNASWCNLCSLASIAFVLWLIFTVSGYANGYAQAMEGWRLGGTHMVELTLVREDREDGGCASDVRVVDVRCEFGADQELAAEPPGKSQALRPYKSITDQLLLGAGLWDAEALRGSLRRGRFTVVCNFHVLGVMRSAALRWRKKDAFSRAKETIPVGKFSQCVIPR